MSDIFRKRKRFSFAHQFGLPVVPLYPVSVVTQGNQMGNNRNGIFTHADMNFVRTNPEYRPSPGMSPLRIFDHLSLVDDGNIVFLRCIEHFDSSGNNPAFRLYNALLSRNHAAGQQF